MILIRFKLFKKKIIVYIVIKWCRVRVVKEIDLKSIGLCPRRFEPCRHRSLSLKKKYFSKFETLLFYNKHRLNNNILMFKLNNDYIIVRVAQLDSASDF